MYDPQCAEFYLADCSHEVYSGERVYLVPGPKGPEWVCPDCLIRWVHRMSCDEIADQMHLQEQELYLPGKDTPCRIEF